MVPDRNAQHAACVDQLARDLAVGGRRGRIPAGVVVHENHGGGSLGEGRSEDLPGVDHGGIEDASGDHHVGDDGVLGVQQKDVKLLLPQIAQLELEAAIYVARRRDAPVLHSHFLSAPSTQLQRCLNAHRSGFADPWNRSQLRTRGGGETSERPAEALVDRLSDLQGRPTARAARQQNGEQLGGAQRAGA